MTKLPLKSPFLTALSHGRQVSRFMLVVGATLAASIPACAGNIFLTGHDDDFHDAAGSSQGAAQFAAAISYVRNGSTKPVLTFDAGSELTSDLMALGIAFVNVNPNNAASVTDALFDPALFSAFAVASDTTCGGCDNNATGEANIAAHETAIDAFLNGGGGIAGFAGANSTGYYNFVPQTATSVGGAPTTGYTQTAAGAAAGIPAANGDFTHNLFFNPGVNGESAFYQVAELNTTASNGVIPLPAAVTLICTGCTTSGGVIVGGSSTPEPGTVVVMSSGLLALAALRRRILRRRQ